jgi:cell division protein FtsL
MAATAPSLPRPEVAPRPRTRSTPRSRPTSRRRSARRSGLFGSVVWIVALAVLLAGVVALNVAVLQLNLRSDRLARDRADLRDANASLQAQLSRAASNPRLESLAQKRLGLVLAKPDQRTDIILEP